MYRGPESEGVPVLLMELMDENLTRYLECCTKPVPYHLQLNICHDVSLGLSFLHSKDMVHMDLSSGTVLLTNGTQMAKLCDFKSMNRPIIEVADSDDCSSGPAEVVRPYAPPGVMRYDSKCNDKIDCFSFGVIFQTSREYWKAMPKLRNRRGPAL